MTRLPFPQFAARFPLPADDGTDPAQAARPGGVYPSNGAPS